jgi:MoaA/NifB/PqqE/SkfB family radical SAM enzyme
MSLALFEKVLRDYSEMGGGYLSLTPATGDVLLDRHLLERLDLIRGYPTVTHVGVTTNAVMLDRFTDADVRRIVDGFHKMELSVYGLDDEEYLAMTRRKTYSRAVDGMRRILAIRRENVFLSFRLLKPHAPEDIDRWIRQTFGDRAPDVLSVYVNGPYANWAVLDTAHALPFGATWASQPRVRSQCLRPLLSLRVCVNGDVAFCPCTAGLPDLLLGNIADQPLLELYNTPRLRALWNWEAHGVPDSCARCTFHIPLETVRFNRSMLANPVDAIS